MSRSTYTQTDLAWFVVGIGVAIAAVAILGVGLLVLAGGLEPPLVVTSCVRYAEGHCAEYGAPYANPEHEAWVRRHAAHPRGEKP
jgi:hypothetical protein